MHNFIQGGNTMNRVLHNKKRSWFNRVIDIYKKPCFCLRSFIHSLTKNMCLSKEDIQEIQQRVANTKGGERKFKEWEKVIPVVTNKIEDINDEIRRLQGINRFCFERIYELYIAEQENDSKRKREIFEEFGLPHILEKDF